MGTYTITTTVPEDARANAAFGNRLQSRDAGNARRDATQAEIKADLLRYFLSVVLDDERSVSARNAMANVLPFTPT